MHELLHDSALTLAERIRSRDVSSREVVEAHIRRIEAVNPAINAVVADRFEDALQEADEADRVLATSSEEAGVLHGVPCTIKEVIGVRGMPNTGANVPRKDAVARRDATVVRRLRKAGAIVLGVTNLSELGLWIETTNVIYGRTNNPFDPDRTSGGSSGGEGAIVGAGGVPFGIGSDMGGSVRFPAFCCGVYGHKPTTGMVPLTGQYPLDHTPHSRDDIGAAALVCTGPIARRATDLRTLLGIIAGPDRECPHTRSIPLSDEEVDWRGRTVLVADDPKMLLTRRTTPEMQQSIRSAGRALEALGANVQSWKSPKLFRALEIYTGKLASMGGANLSQTIGPGTSRKALRELVKHVWGDAQHHWHVLVMCIIEGGLTPSKASIEANLRRLRELKSELDQKLGPDGVLLMPPHPSVATPHSHTLRMPGDVAYTAIFNALGYPGTAVPMGLSPEGLPLGTQVVARQGNDHLCIAAAEALERYNGGWAMPRIA